MTAADQPGFVEHASWERGFGAYFDAEIAPLLTDLEAHRLTVLRSIRRRRLVAIVLSAGFAAALGLVVLVPPRDDFFLMLPAPILIAAIGMWIAVLAARKAYQNNRKSTLMPAVLGFFGRFRYAAKGGVPVRALQQSDLYPGWNKASLTDEISGDYQGRDFVLAELLLTREVRTERRDHTEKRVWPVFRGVLIRLALDQPADERVMRDIHSLVSRTFPDEHRSAVTEGALWLAIPCRHDHFESGPVSETALQTDDIRQMLADTVRLLNLTEKISLRLAAESESGTSSWQSGNLY
ncbi:MAG: hypothetical protein RIC36_20270 [Rhodospirillales bacterium]